MAIEDKASFSSRMINVVGGRLATSLLSGENAEFSDALSKLPTNISSWLSKLVSSPISSRRHLLFCSLSNQKNS